MKNLLAVPRLSGPASVALVTLRVVAGIAFVLHGWDKIQNPFGWMGPDATIPGFFQMLAAVSEVGGGIAWALGFLTPLASLGLLSTMAVAVWMHAIKMGDPFVSKGGGSYEPAAIYLCIALLLLLAGPGRLSADRAIFGERG